MSTLKVNSAQIGQSVTATNNFTWYQPSTPDGTVRLGNGNSGSVTDLVTVNSSGSVGIGTSSPNGKFEVGGGSGATGVQSYFSSAAGYAAPAAANASFSGGTKLVLWNDTSTPQKLSIGMDGGASMWFCNTGAQAGGNNAGFSWYQGSTAGATPAITMRLDSSGNLGLGVTPSAWSGFKALQVNYGGFSSFLSGSNIQTGVFSNAYFDGSVYRFIAATQATYYNQNNGSHQWYNSNNTSGTAGGTFTPTQAMTLDASGNLLVGQTSANATTAGFGVYNTSSKYWCYVAGASSSNADNAFSAYSTTAGAYRFIVGYGGTIQATSTSITGISDISLKENIHPLETGLAEVLALQPRRFDWKNGDGFGIAGFIAQEVEPILPDLVSDYKYSDEETKKGLKMGDMIPTLVKAIQELSTELNELKAKVNA